MLGTAEALFDGLAELAHHLDFFFVAGQLDREGLLKCNGGIHLVLKEFGA